MWERNRGASVEVKGIKVDELVAVGYLLAMRNVQDSAG
jgi:hypothetical protein